MLLSVSEVTINVTVSFQPFLPGLVCCSLLLASTHLSWLDHTPACSWHHSHHQVLVLTVLYVTLHVPDLQHRGYRLTPLQYDHSVGLAHAHTKKFTGGMQLASIPRQLAELLECVCDLQMDTEQSDLEIYTSRISKPPPRRYQCCLYKLQASFFWQNSTLFPKLAISYLNDPTVDLLNCIVSLM